MNPNTLTLKDVKICRPDGTEVAGITDAEVKVPIQQEAPRDPVGPLGFKGTFRTKVKQAFVLALLGVKRKSKAATLAALQRQGMTKAQAQRYMHPQ